MPGRFVYELLYRIGAASWKRGWDAGVGPELVRLVEDGPLSPQALGGNRAVDLGCGTGANVLFLAKNGFEAIGIDFSNVAVRQAGERAAAEGISDRVTFLVGDITEPHDGARGPFDLIVLYNVVQDLDGEARAGLAERTRELSRLGTRVLLWCWYARRDDLPLVSFKGPSRIAPFVIEPGEERALFDGFAFERLESPGPRKAAFVLTRL
ncbi:MAG TPA: class I SAM-dependent methyltransferase [Actinomycetota bacterium]|nr:class I SAM-dependent methyltransferase [Actinomycetota bacterium]